MITERHKFEMIYRGADPRRIREISPYELEGIVQGWSQTPMKREGLVVFDAPPEFSIGSKSQRVTFYSGKKSYHVFIAQPKKDDYKKNKILEICDINSPLHDGLASHSIISQISMPQRGGVELYPLIYYDEDFGDEETEWREKLEERTAPFDLLNFGLLFGNNKSYYLSWTSESRKPAYEHDKVSHFVPYLAEKRRERESFFYNIWNYIADSLGLRLESDKNVLRAYDEKSKITYRFNSWFTNFLFQMVFNKPVHKDYVDDRLKSYGISEEEIFRPFWNAPDLGERHTYGFNMDNAYKIPEFIRAMRTSREN